MRTTTNNFPKGIRVSGLILSPDHKKIILMERYKDSRHFYAFPGGGFEDIDKSYAKALKREIHEETNAEIKNEERVYELDIIGHSKQFFYVCESSSETLSLVGEEKDKNSEADRYIPAWFHIGDLPNMLIFPIEIRDWLVSDLQKGSFTHHQELFQSTDMLRKS